MRYSLIVVMVWQSALALGEPTGWRADGGRYPDAAPVFEWSDTKNVVWKTPTPNWGNGTPIVVGDRVFIGMEKTKLLCLSLKDGRIQWEKETTLADALSTEERAGAAEKEKQGQELTREIAALDKESKDVAKKLKAEPASADLKARKDELAKQIAELKGKLRAIEKFLMPPTNGTNGYSSPTPVSDGRLVWVIYCTGVATCFDLEGNRKWAVALERSQDNYGLSASPALAGDTLIVHINDCHALDAATGAERWKAPSKPHYGSPVLAKTDGENVVMTVSGDLFRVKDGQKLGGGLFSVTYNSPVLNEGIVYAADMGNAVAAKLPAKADGSEKPEVLWKTTINKDRHYASPLVHDGILYAVSQKGILTALETKTGQKLYEQQADGLGKGTVYSSLVLAGHRILVSIDSGATSMVEPGRTYKTLGTTTLEKFRSTPVFAGNQMLVRGLKNMYCIGAK